MGQYVKYLVCYDVEDNKLRKKLADRLLDLGLVRLQKSVFYGDLKAPEVGAMKRAVRELLKEENDRCFWLPCRIDLDYLRKCVGYKDFVYDEPDDDRAI